MSDPRRPLRVNAVELLRQPGSVKTVELTIPAEPLEATHERLAGDVDGDTTAVLPRGTPICR